MSRETPSPADRAKAERLAAALRANLKRRKQPRPDQAPLPDAD
ncbi:hypothetical protein [Sphingomonas sp.]